MINPHATIIAARGKTDIYLDAIAPQPPRSIEAPQATREQQMTKPTVLLGRSLSYAGLAKDLAVLKRTNDATVRGNARLHLAQRMGRLHGLPQKMGQIMSMSADAEKATAFTGLTDSAEPLPLDVVRPILEGAWGGPIDSVLARLEPEARAASLGQVHRGLLHSGEAVAVKIAYPGIRDAVESDLKLLGWLSAPVGNLRRGFDLADYRAEIARDLKEELDYRAELRNQTRYAELARAVDGLVVPRVFERWSTDQVLTAEWEDGDTIDQAAEWPARQREELARRMLGQFLSFVFDHGFVHGDPHVGNYRFRDDAVNGPTVVLYDFGSMAAVTERDRLLLLRLIADTAERRGNPMELLTGLGFNQDLLAPIRSKLPAVCSVLFEPFIEVAKYDLATWHRKERLDDILGDDRWNFRMAGPAKLILLMRAFHGLLYYLQRLAEPVSWGLMLKPILARHASAVAEVESPSCDGASGRFESMATHLRIEVHRQGVKKVSLTLPAGAVEDLNNLIDEDIATRIAARGIDLTDIVRQVRASGFAPRELFTLDEPDSDRRLRVWIE